MVAVYISPSVMAQTLPIPADQQVVVIEPSPAGNLETIINGDVDENNNRVNPKRIYMLKAGQVYLQKSGINFGGDNDSTAVLTIIGEEGGAKPMVLRDPGEGAGAFSNNVHGSLTLKNTYWGITNMNKDGSLLFKLYRSNQRLILDGIVTENAWSGDVFVARDVRGELDVYIKNCYFRDNSQLANSWNYSVIARGDNGEAFDTLWVENTTITHSGMPFFGKLNSINFAFFNHNLFINGTKYPLWFERFKEAYFTNNMFINSNFEGECRSTWETQIGEDFIHGGLINVDTLEAAWFSSPIAPEDAIFYAADNLNYTSQYLDNYWAGAYNTVADYPISNRVWGSVTEADLPLQVFPVPLYNDRTIGMAAGYDNIKIERSHIDTDPQMVTKGIANQNVGNQYAYFARSNYGVAEAGESWDKTLMWFGDADPETVPGGGTESGYSITDATDFPEDFSYTADIISGIDSLPLGSLFWYPDLLCRYDSEDQLQRAKDALGGIFHPKPACGGSTGLADKKASYTSLEVYPNPAMTQFSVNSDAKTLIIYNSIGQKVMELNNYLKGTPISATSLDKGIYIIHDGEQMEQLVIE